jgi:ABC-2 type transport system ATP-binding protein
MATGLPYNRVDEALALVGLTEVANKRVGGFSMGMRQRLELATAILGDPDVLILDEPSNGLDPQGIQWLRTFIRHQASTGRAVLVSSHLLSEMEETVDDVVIVSHGKLVLQTTLAELRLRTGTGGGMRVRTPEAQRLVDVLAAQQVGARWTEPDVIMIDSASPEWLGPVLAQNQIIVYDLRQEGGGLEEVFLSLTSGFDAPMPEGVPS